MINFCGGTAVPCPILEENDFSFDLESFRKLVTPKTKLVILNTPSNPTGGVLDRALIEGIADIARNHTFMVLSDEIYGRLIYEGGPLFSITQCEGLRDRTVILDGFSKAYAMTGWRLGYGVGPKDLIARMTKLQVNSASCTASFTQMAGIEALRGPQDSVDAMAKTFRERRDRIVAGLNAIPGICVPQPEGRVLRVPEHHEDREIVRRLRTPLARSSRRGRPRRHRVRQARRRALAAFVRELDAEHRRGVASHRGRRGRLKPSPMRIADFRSDTVTTPGPAMRAAMAEAVVGDDVFGEDPTVAALEAEGARVLGKEAALFLPSGTMANQVAVGLWTRHGDEVLLHEGCHVYRFETGALAALNGVQVRTLAGAGGVVPLASYEREVRPAFEAYPRTSLVVLENTHNWEGGAVLPLDHIDAVGAFAHARGLKLHLDGARLMNASIASGTPCARIARVADSVTLCLSKGLGAPAGTLLASDRASIVHARRLRKRLGGGMRQVGILAAAGLMALREGPSALSTDHARARRLLGGRPEPQGRFRRGTRHQHGDPDSRSARPGRRRSRSRGSRRSRSRVRSGEATLRDPSRPRRRRRRSRGRIPPRTLSIMSIFKAYDVRGIYKKELDEALAARIGAAFVRVTGARSLAVGRDMRESAPSIARAFIDGAAASGATVIDIGLASTPMTYYAIGSLGVDGGAQVTASHNPAEWIGFKFCRKGCVPMSSATGIREMEALIADGLEVPSGPRADVATRDLLSGFASHVASFGRPERPLKIVIDAGNGMGGHTAPAILDAWGVDAERLYFELDGAFPNHEANPVKAENIRDLVARVRATGADIGIAFDGDADRCVFVDERGEAVPSDAVTAIFARELLARYPGDSVVYDLRSSRAIPELVAESGGRPVRERVGHSFIKATMRREKSVLGANFPGTSTSGITGIPIRVKSRWR
jgi:phosphomannomutase